MNSKSIVPYTPTYKEKCFDAYFLAGRPPEVTRIIEIIPEDEYGRKPSPAVIRRWQKEYNWEWRGDDLDAQVRQEADKTLIQKKVEMLSRHYEDAVALSDVAVEQLLNTGFDSSAAAVNAYFRGTEEQRKIQGFGELFEKLSKMDDQDIQKRIIELLSRASANEQVIDVVDISEDKIEEDENDIQEGLS